MIASIWSILFITEDYEVIEINTSRFIISNKNQIKTQQGNICTGKAAVSAPKAQSTAPATEEPAETDARTHALLWYPGLMLSATSGDKEIETASPRISPR